eukprot:GHRQ01030878.1.p2 GENE.GHRQ01030878.1~~GHRQ01030878.1.p2  ORF type:complete len:111 (+),score=14.89 GHRQ01030878.1:366-698(+)
MACAHTCSAAACCWWQTKLSSRLPPAASKTPCSVTCSECRYDAGCGGGHQARMCQRAHIRRAVTASLPKEVLQAPDQRVLERIIHRAFTRVPAILHDVLQLLELHIWLNL